MGSFMLASRSMNWRWSRDSVVREGMCCCNEVRSSWPVFPLQGHSNSSCVSVPVACLQSLQSGEGEIPILCRRCCEQSKSCSSFQRKEDSSGDKPSCLHRDQDSSQSVAGLAISGLVGRNSLSPVSMLASMVTWSSVRSLDQSFSDRVNMLSEVCDLTFLMISKSSGERYGGSWLGTPGT